MRKMKIKLDRSWKKSMNLYRKKDVSEWYRRR